MLDYLLQRLYLLDEDRMWYSRFLIALKHVF